ncbi:MAG: HlyC/CorC family transporter [Pseudomonadales bacterium]|nr:HlyC/CorC family transporter [Pseudomonadales bacterium]
MSTTSLELLLGLLVFLIVASAYFSSSETAMMSLNRYRLRHLTKQQHKGAIRVSKLLDQPDRLIGIILIGNNFVNFLASSIGTIIAIHLFGDGGAIISTILLTIIFLIFAEVTPKTIAAIKPELIAFPSSLLLLPLLWLFYPVVWLVNGVSNGLIKLLGYEIKADDSHHLSPEELRTVVDESGARIPVRRQNMLLNILDLEKVTVNDIMVPRNEVVGINIEDDISVIMDQISNSQHTRLPVYKKDLNNVLGILHMRSAAKFINSREINQSQLLLLTRESYFVPESTPLHTQLLNFQKNKRRIALVVDEYGDIIGIVTLEDILEEIVGNFTSNLAEQSEDIHPQADGTYLIDGSAYIREINRVLNWNLPTNGPKTLNGLLTEMLESIPENNNVGISLPQHRAEIIQVKDNMIKTVRMWVHDPEFNEENTHRQPSLFP